MTTILMKYAQIAIPRPIETPLIYIVPEHLEGKLQPGHMVLVPFHSRLSAGYVIAIGSKPPEKLDPKNIKELKELFDEKPVFSGEMLELIKWMSSYYCSPIGEVCRAALPTNLNRLKAPKKNGHYEAHPPLNPLPSREGKKHTLTAEQQTALNAILASMNQKNPKPILLHGITGSGKTEVYLRAFEEIKKMGGSGLLLVPEISLTPQLVQRFCARFGDAVAMYHSGLSDALRHQQWEKMRKGEVFATIGTRSALFAPFENLRLIIVDEEHDSSYKQEEGFLYNANNAAIVRAKICGATILLGSATPSIESLANTKREKYNYFRITTRATGAKLPAVEIVDMRGVYNKSSISETLLSALRKTLEKKEQALIFLNRRGFAGFLLCTDCGHTFKCPNCDIALTYHTAPLRLLCHYCDFAIPAPDICPKCNNANLKTMGHGTEQVEKDLVNFFPNASIARLDRDTSSKIAFRKTFLSRMQKSEIDILVGTQMIAKGHDFPNVTLVGVINADTSLHLPDFRSFERTFQILTQVSGRAGRADKPGTVIIQTYQPDHPSLVFAKEHNFEAFFDTEKKQRQMMKYPPFTRIANLRFSANTEEHALGAAKSAVSVLIKQLKLMNLEKIVDLLGPAQAPLYKIRGKFRWQLLIKAPTAKQLSELLKTSIPLIKNSAPSGCRVIVDVDPLNMM